MWLVHGVETSTNVATQNQDLYIRYTGLLRNSGAESVVLHYGSDGWKNAKDAEMWKEPDGSFKVKIKAEANHELNFCFKDNAENWDNNNGYNWSLRII